MKSAPRPDASPSNQNADARGEPNSRGEPNLRGVTRRVVILCLGLAVFFGYFSPIIDHKLANTFLGATHLPPGAIAVLLFLLLVINPVLRLISTRLCFSRNETLVVYISCLFSVLVPGHGAENIFISNLLGPFYFATRENKWLQNIEGTLPWWFSPALSGGGGYSEGGRAAVAGWYQGGALPWNLWLAPLVMWSTMILASYLMLACLSVILRKQWAQYEALAFPLLRLPLEMTEEGDAARRGSQPFFANPMMWLGFGVAAVIQFLNGLNFYFSDIPLVPLSINTAALFSDAPWNQMGVVGLRLWPMAIGITFLLTAEMSFSLWFFYWFFKFQLILAYYLGYVPATLPAIIGRDTKIFQGFQQVGGFVAYAALMVWAGREHFRYVARRALGRETMRDDEREEALSYPLAFWGFVLSLAFLIGWSMAAGVSAPVALMLWGGYLVIAIGLTRVVAEAGLLFVQQGWTPLGTIAQLLGSGPGTLLSPASIAPATFIQGAMMSDLRAFLMPSFLQSFKLAHDRKIAARPLLALIFAVIALSFGVSVYTHLRLGYESGALQWGHKWWVTTGGSAPGRSIGEMARGARDVSPLNWLWLAGGGVMTLAIVMARARFLWFPLHPLGVLMGITSPVNHFWASIFVGWSAKVLIGRFGGNDTVRKITPAFLGLVLGDVVMMVFWLLIDGWQGRSNHPLMPG